MTYNINYFTICGMALFSLLFLINQIMLYFSKKTKEEEKSGISSQIFHQIAILLLLYIIYKLLNTCKNPDVML